LLCVRPLEAPDADAEDRMMRGEPYTVDDELRAAARRVVQSDVRVADDRAAHARRGDTGADEYRRDEAERSARAPAPRHRREHEDNDDQCCEARLRERKE